MLYPPFFGDHPQFPCASDFEVVRKNAKTGSGVITRRSYKAGELLAVMTGEVIPEIRQHTLQIAPDKHLYDPWFSGYFLHSCSPNISLDMQAMTVTALRPIRSNSYLYMDYAETEDTLFRQFPCKCGSRACRGWITGRLEVPSNFVVPSQTAIAEPC